MQIYRHPQWNTALYNFKSTDYPWLHNDDKLRTSTRPHIQYSNVREVRVVRLL
jgi:hypothetical protein